MRLFSTNNQTTFKIAESIDWANHPLGPIEKWDPLLIHFLNFIFNSKQPCFLFWSEEAYCFYNDGYVPILGNEKHPKSMGARAIDIWKEIWTIYTYPQFAQAMKGEPTWNIDHFIPISRDGQIVEAYFTYGYSPIFLNDGKVGGVLTTAVETTDKVLAVKSSKNSEEQLSIAVDVTKLGFFDWDIVNDKVTFNEQMQHDWGIEPETPISRALELIHPDDRHITSRAIKVALEDGVPYDVRYRVVHPREGIRWIEAKGQVYYEDKRPVRFFGTSVNVTVKHKTLLALEEAQKDLQLSLYSRDEFLSIASHELKTPLTSLKLQTQIVKKRLHGLTNDSQDVGRIDNGLSQSLKQIDRLTELVDTLLDISKIQQEKMTFDFHEVDICPLVEEVVDRLADMAKSTDSPIVVTCPKNLTANWDRFRIDQVLMNLLSNAIKYAPGKPIELKVEPQGNNTKIIVKDGGKGIPEQDQGKIFDRFERIGASKNVSGLGLGLYIVKQIVLGHEGTIEVKSVLDQGTEFTIVLPK